MTDYTIVNVFKPHYLLAILNFKRTTYMGNISNERRLKCKYKQNVDFTTKRNSHSYCWKISKYVGHVEKI